VTSSIQLILASASPRRANLLTQMGLSYQVFPSHIPEDVLEGESPEAHAQRLALEKAREVWGDHQDTLVVAGDTIVVLDGEILGKPADAKEAVAMLMALSGRIHTVVSGLAVAFPNGSAQAGSMSTEVTFSVFDEATARAYVDTGEPMDKAGSYGIQGLGSTLVKEISGDYHTVVGLPIPLFLGLLRSGGWQYEFGALVPLKPEATQ
jgi:septum formation protein